MDIIAALGVGHENAVTREALAAKLGTSDRAARRRIELARRDGWCIMNDGDGAGYYLANDMAALERHYHVEMARANTILRNLHKLHRELRKAGRL